jgi:hypothetical protein
MFHLVFINGFLIECIVAFNMKSVKEKSFRIKFCFIVGKTAAETHNMSRYVYGDDALS